MDKLFIPYEFAVQLKDLGFNEPCLATYRGMSLYHNYLSFKKHGGDMPPHLQPPT